MAAKTEVILPKYNMEMIKKQETSGNGQSSERLIAIGASTGGTEAIYDVLKNLTPDCPGIVIVQHIPPVFSKMFAERLDTQTLLRCKEAENGRLSGKWLGLYCARRSAYAN